MLNPPDSKHFVDVAIKNVPISSPPNVGDINKLFYSKKIVFKISKISQSTNKEQDYIMVTRFKDYLQKLKDTRYNPLTYAVSLQVRIAYLYDCLNKKYNKPSQFLYVVYYRQLNTNEWNKWFIIRPYYDNRR